MTDGRRLASEPPASSQNRRSRSRIRTPPVPKDALPVASLVRGKAYRYVLMQHDVCHFFARETGSCGARPENGGILIGSYRGPHMEITGWTEPGKIDVR